MRKVGKEDALTIEVRPPGWQVRTIVTVAITVVWCVMCYREENSFVGLAVGIGLGLLGLDRFFTGWRLKVSPALVSVARWSLFTSRSWTCRRDQFQVGKIETVPDGEGASLFGVDSCVRLLGFDEEVPFMSGHRDPELEVVRSKILTWIEANPALIESR